MTTPAAPGAPDGGQQQDSGQQPAPGAQDSGRGHQGQQQAQPRDDAQGQQTQDVSSLPEWAQNLIRDTRKEAGKARTTAKQQAADEARKQLMGELGKALGLDSEEPLPEHIQKRLTEADERAAAAEARAVEASYRDSVRTTAAGLNLDADALLDSGKFRDAVSDELNEEFDDDDLAKAIGKVAKRPEFAKAPRFAKANGAARSGPDMAGAVGGSGPQRPASLSEAVRRHFGGS